MSGAFFNAVHLYQKEAQKEFTSRVRRKAWACSGVTSVRFAAGEGTASRDTTGDLGEPLGPSGEPGAS